MMDQTAEILARGGRPEAIATYAIHEADRAYREATGRPGTSTQQFAAAIDARRAALTAILAEFDRDRQDGEWESFPIRQARGVILPWPGQRGGDTR
jgi:hypothetical protein